MLCQCVCVCVCVRVHARARASNELFSQGSAATFRLASLQFSDVKFPQDVHEKLLKSVIPFSPS